MKPLTLDGLKNALLKALQVLKSLIVKQQSMPPSLPPPLPTEPPAIVEPLAWDTPQAARHAARVTMDNAGLTWDEKNLLTAVIQAESGFKIDALNANRDDTGHILSKDYSICQINDYYHIGPGKDFPSVQYVYDNPAKCIEWMIKQYRAGHLNWWIAYRNGSYKAFV